MTMKTLTLLVRSLGLVALVLAVGVSAALAHGTPTLAAQPATVAAGGKMTLNGDGLGEDGETVTLTLKGMLFQAQLGTAKLSDDSLQDTTFTIPAKAPAGTYLIVVQNGSITANTSIEVTAAAPAKAVPAANTPQPTVMPTAMAEMTTPAPTVTQVTTGASVASNQTTVATPIATTEPVTAQATAVPLEAGTSAATSVATAVPPRVATEEATQPDIDTTPAANSSVDQTTGAVMPMPGAAPVLVRTRSPIEWALPIGVVVVGGALGLFLVTRDW
jgi:hypothetical protein